ncbi:MAG: hypothetical protein O3C70_00480 [Actinomycetota bacterium]|nr:hypothetical protein [Actinomycetota bacterium]
MRLRDLVMAIVVAVLAVTLVVTSTLTDLRSPDGTEALGATLADDDAVRTLIVAGAVDAILEDATERSGVLGPLVPLVGPLLEASVVAALDTSAGRAALASALTDALRQLTVPGPIAIDLRRAALVAAEEVPAPLDTLIRTAVAEGGVGVLVLGDIDEDDGGTVEGPQPLAPEDVGRVAGLAPGLARWLSALALAAAVLLLAVPGTRTDASPGARPTRRSIRLTVTGSLLLATGVATTLLLRMAPDTVTERLVASLPEADAVGDALPSLLIGIVELLGPTGGVALVLTVIGAIGVVAGMLTRSSRH